MSRLAGLAEEAGVPLLIHVNEQIGHQYPGKGDVGAVEAYRFAVKFPKTNAIFAHLGGGLPFFASMPEVRSLENIYYDTAAQPYLFGAPVYLSLKVLGILSKILLGSDYPLLSCARYIREMEKSGLLAEDVQAVSYDNAMGLFGNQFSSP